MTVADKRAHRISHTIVSASVPVFQKRTILKVSVGYCRERSTAEAEAALCPEHRTELAVHEAARALVRKEVAERET